MATTGNFVSTPLLWTGVLSAANINRDGTGTLVTLGTAPSTGARVERVIVKAGGTTTAGMVRLFVHDGTNARLITEVPVAAVTPSATVPSFETVVDLANLVDAAGRSVPNPFVLPSGASLRATTHNAETFYVTAIGGSF